jgi:hypothetical protein
MLANHGGDMHMPNWAIPLVLIGVPVFALLLVNGVRHLWDRMKGRQV